MLAEMGKTMLERLGYKVTFKTNSIEALKTIQNQPDQFDLVITDQTMPDMTQAAIWHAIYCRYNLECQSFSVQVLATGFPKKRRDSSE